jgi:RND family efflux transporter MFP subunit
MTNKTLILGLIFATSILACSGNGEEQAGEEEVVKTVNVVTQEITPSTFTSYVRVVGNVETSNDIMISAEVNGKVISYNVKEGDPVRKGQTILKLDDSKLKQEKARLEAMTSQAKDNYERLKKIYEEEGIGSEMDYLNAKYSYEQSNSALESIKVDLENTNIKAPFNGRVEEKMINVGEMAAPGTPVVRLIGSDDYKITAGVPARYAGAINPGDKVDVWFDTQVADTLEGTIRFVGTSINPQNRTFKIEINLPEDASQFKVDMISNIRLKTYQRENVSVISEEFVYSKDDHFVVYVASTNESGRKVAREVPVELGMSYKTDVIVENGLNNGDQLITIGSAFLDEGTRITIKEDENSSLAAN